MKNRPTIYPLAFRFLLLSVAAVVWMSFTHAANDPVNVPSAADTGVQPATMSIEVSGAVKNPGKLDLPAEARFDTLMELAGLNKSANGKFTVTRVVNGKTTTEEVSWDQADFKIYNGDKVVAQSK